MPDWVKTRWNEDAHNKSAEQRLALLVDALTDYSIYMVELDGTVATWNKGAERNKGYVTNEIIGQNFHRFFTKDDQASGKPDALLKEACRLGKVEEEGWRVQNFLVEDGIYPCGWVFVA